ncbi:hypothetical protein SEA_ONEIAGILLIAN_65 [Microbacterium phage OneinaGillian]|uniref:Uncharacterized protein n=1 Tax=Microbacterium phage OneinaGillian TaxID=2301604 RepID=A0A385UGP4_9CAUD|nr:hypothetical protein HOU23_gp065 [Microbacterium phage OneinaGillian]AYB70175.1 hypothetical protein SEA_ONEIAGILLIAN_65 [Microbacterium phage OneinaGillian]QJD53289.1 hypothetical protein SEA_TEMPO_67 [Microbacterium phage Tempo]WNN94092.1 hypothetical protein SEA_FREGLEY_67 [Microbacterium phage Fregley]WNT44276.1 hypothetical protein SEA_CANDC_64 [Microbacterium phage CandC]
MAERSYERNAGYLSLTEIPDDQYIVGAVVVLMDGEGNYSTVYVNESLDSVPDPEVQEVQGPLIATAFSLANFGVRP